MMFETNRQPLLSLLSILLLMDVSFAIRTCPDNYRLSPDSLKCVRVYSNRTNVYAAATLCEMADTLNGYLVSIHSAFENQFIRSLIDEFSPNSTVLIGLIDLHNNGTYEWSDSSNVNYQNWKTGNPTTELDAQCVAMNVVNDGALWTNVNCTDDNYAFICQIASIDNNTSSTTTTTWTSTTTSNNSEPVPYASDCVDLLQSGIVISGIYPIYQRNRKYYVYCDMDTNGGGWTVVQRRNSSEPLFYNRSLFEYYISGFGDANGNHWQPVDLIYRLSNSNGAGIWRFEISGNRCAPTDCQQQFPDAIVGYQEYQMTIDAYPYRTNVPYQSSVGNLWPAYGINGIAGIDNSSLFTDVDVYCSRNNRNCGPFWNSFMAPNGYYNQPIIGNDYYGVSYNISSAQFNITGMVYPAYTAVKLRRNLI